MRPQGGYGIHQQRIGVSPTRCGPKSFPPLNEVNEVKKESILDTAQPCVRTHAHAANW